MIAHDRGLAIGKKIPIKYVFDVVNIASITYDLVPNDVIEALHGKETYIDINKSIGDRIYMFSDLEDIIDYDYETGEVHEKTRQKLIQLYESLKTLHEYPVFFRIEGCGHIPLHDD